MRRYWKGHYLRELPDDAIKAFLARGQTGDGDPELLPYGGFQSYGGAIAEVGEDETAFSHRDALVEFVAVAAWADPAEDEARMSAARRWAAAIEPYASGVYVNDLADEGEAGVRRAYGPRKLARLATLKRRYDPDNLFHLNTTSGLDSRRARAPGRVEYRVLRFLRLVQDRYQRWYYPAVATNLRLRRDVADAVRAAAIESGRSQQEIIREAIDRYLALAPISEQESDLRALILAGTVHPRGRLTGRREGG